MIVPVHRLACMVPGCAATRGLRKEDRGIMPRSWICGAHWRGVPDALRREYRHLQRLERREAERQGAPPAALAGRVDAEWARCVAAASEQAGGIEG